MDCVRRDCGYFNRTPRSPCAPFDGKRRSLGVDLVGAKSELAIGRAKLSGSAKVAFSVADSEIRWAELVPSRTVLTLSVQNGPACSKSALEKLGPIWPLGSIWLFSFYSVVSETWSKLDVLIFRGVTGQEPQILFVID